MEGQFRLPIFFDIDILLSKLEKLNKFRTLVRPIIFHVICGFKLLKSFVITLYFLSFMLLFYINNCLSSTLNCFCWGKGRGFGSITNPTLRILFC